MADPPNFSRTDAGTSGFLNSINIPLTSPLSSSFPARTTAEAPTDESRLKSGKPPSVTRSEIALPDPTSVSRMQPVQEKLADATPEASEMSAIQEQSQTSPDIAAVSKSNTPVLVITLMLTSGARHPYKIDERYLTKRNVKIPGTTNGGKKDPASISVYTLKELILREWRQDWEPQPSSPSSVRLIYFGKLLYDSMTLKDCRFNTEAPNIVHMTVRPQDMGDEDDGGKGKGMAREGHGNEGTAGCRCLIL